MAAMKKITKPSNCGMTNHMVIGVPNTCIVIWASTMSTSDSELAWMPTAAAARISGSS